MQRIVISDDHAMISMMFGMWLQQLALDATVVATPTTGQATLEAVREYMPDVLIQDMMLRDMDGVLVIRQIRQEFPSMKILAITAKPAYAKAALELGVDGCMLKEDRPQVLKDALIWNRANGQWVSPVLQQRLHHARMVYQQYDFSGEEEQILRLLHLSNGEIARKLNISEVSVRSALTKLYRKVGVLTRADLADLAYNVLLLSPLYPS
ncbi:MAG: response regulator transcription factor [Bacteroidota bacterium]|nr:response regulator transcription factor [Bacteroidota bacterium]